MVPVAILAENTFGIPVGSNPTLSLSATKHTHTHVYKKRESQSAKDAMNFRKIEIHIKSMIVPILMVS